MTDGSPTGAGRFAPSPSGDLHLGNLRTALLAWLFARSTGRRFLLRIEDLDRARAGSAGRQLADLAALGLNWDGEVLVQSHRFARYATVVDALIAAGVTYECFCTRREIQEATTAPHGPAGAYPGTCRFLSDADRVERRLLRPAALRLRATVDRWTVFDQLAGSYTGIVDDFVLRRGDGVVAYNLAVVVDDAEQGIDQVVRGDDLLPSTPRQAYLGHLLGYSSPIYAHVPLAVNVRGQRLAKRDGAVTLADLAILGQSPTKVLEALLTSLNLHAVPGSDFGNLADLPARFEPAALPRTPWVVDASVLLT